MYIYNICRCVKKFKRIIVTRDIEWGKKRAVVNIEFVNKWT